MHREMELYSWYGCINDITILLPPALQSAMGYLLHLAQYARLRNVGHVDKNVISRMTVKWGTQSLLIKVVSDKPDAASEDKEAIQCTNLDQPVSQLTAL